jgi:hypothetical protein
MNDEFDEDEEMLYEGAQCSWCDLDLDPRSVFCQNDRCPFYTRFQDEIVRWSPPDEDEETYIEQARARNRGSG